LQTHGFQLQHGAKHEHGIATAKNFQIFFLFKFLKDSNGNPPARVSMKVVLDNKEALHAVEDRLQKAVDYVLESNTKLRSSERKMMRNKLTQLTSCLTLKVPPAAYTAPPARSTPAPHSCATVCYSSS
jgi:hypothetical protein